MNLLWTLTALSLGFPQEVGQQLVAEHLKGLESAGAGVDLRAMFLQTGKE